MEYETTNDLTEEEQGILEVNLDVLDMLYERALCTHSVRLGATTLAIYCAKVFSHPEAAKAFKAIFDANAKIFNESP